MPIGFSFAPGSDIQTPGRGAGPGVPRGMSPQQAVKILSLRVPESMPSNAPINRSLLTSPGGAAAGASGLQSMIQQLIQGFKPAVGLPQTSAPMRAPSLAGPVTGAPVQQPVHSASQAAPPLSQPVQPWEQTTMFDATPDGFDFSGMNAWEWLLRQDLDDQQRQEAMQRVSQFYTTPAPSAQQVQPPKPKFTVQNPIPAGGANV